MRRDADRAQLPPGSVWNLVDFIPDELQAAASGRGGWTYAGAALSGATRIEAAGYFPDNGKVIAIDQGGTAWDVAAATSPGGIGINPIPTGNPFYHRGKLIFPLTTIPGAGTVPYYYDGSTVTTLTGAPKCMVGCVYKDHAVLARTNNTTGTQNTNRVFFSAAGDPTTWDLTFGWWDTTGIVTGLATVPNAILVFHGDSVERLRGTTPPPGSDMVLEPFFNDGCLDPFSIAYWRQNVVFASSRGVYLTNGVSTVDLTAEAGLKTYWASLVSSYTPATWRVGGGIYRDHYIISINNGNTLVDCLCFSLQNRTAWRFTNLHGSAFQSVTTSTQEKLYMGQWNAGRVAELSSLWSPGSSVKQDGDGTNPTPIIETGAFRGYDRLHRRWIESYGLQKWRYVYLDHDLRDAASDNPTITLSYATTPTGSYTTAAGGSIPETTDYSRVKRYLNATPGGATRSDMLELKLAVNGPYASAKVYALECDFSPIDIGRTR